MAQVNMATQCQNLTFSVFRSTGEIYASYQKDEVEMQLKMKIPQDYPLKTVEVEVSKQLKLQEK